MSEDKALSTEEAANTADKSHGLTVDYWKNKWTERKIGFHQDNVHELLQKHKDVLLEGREELRIFIPLCGKTLDMKWLYDMGHTVIGVDCTQMAIEEFYEEQELEYTTEDVPEFEGQVFKTNDGRLRLYCGDFFKFTPNIEGGFNAVWDRGAFVAISPSDRQKYCTLLVSLMSRDCKYLLSALIYDQSKYSGPPHCSPFEDVKKIYGGSCNLEELDSVDVLTDHQRDNWGIESLFENIILITRK